VKMNGERAGAWSRRELLGSGAVVGATQLLSGPERSYGSPKPAITVRDRLWLWSHTPDNYNGKWAEHYKLPGKTRMTPVEASYYMSIPNIFMNLQAGTPEPPLAQYGLKFRTIREVVWGIVGAGGETNAAEREAVLELVFQTPNISGVVMDDFFSLNKQGRLPP
jgi:hypothetical protein